MNLQQIKNAVDAGQTVHWSNTAYQVVAVNKKNARNLLQTNTSNVRCIKIPGNY